MGLDKFDLVRGQVILAVKLLVDFRHRLAPINVGMGSKILKGATYFQTDFLLQSWVNF